MYCSLWAHKKYWNPEIKLEQTYNLKETLKNLLFKRNTVSFKLFTMKKKYEGNKFTSKDVVRLESTRFI